MNNSRLLGAVSALFVAVIGISIWLPTSAVAGSYAFTKIVDTNDAKPVGEGNFINFGYPALDAGDIAFGTYDHDFGYHAVLTYKNGTLKVIADTESQIPDGAGSFGRVYAPKISQGNIIFGGQHLGKSLDSRQLGIYTDLGGGLRTVVDLNTPVPGGIGNFMFDTLDVEDTPMISNGVVAFGTNTGTGVYAEINQALRVIVDQNTPEPDSNDKFSGGYLAGMNGGDIAFSGRIDSKLYLYSTASISKITDNGDHIDVATGTYSVVEYNQDSSQRALHINVGGIPQLVAAIGDATPDGTGSFTFFDNQAVDGDEIAFLAVEDNVDGNIFRYADGVIDEVISIGDVLDSKTVTNLGISNDNSFDNGAIAFQVDFNDQSSGIYLATPAPSSTLIDLGGTIKTPDGTDICAVVLASGQLTFSCNPIGVFSLTDLPRDQDGTVKRQIYADGFSPKIDILNDSTNEAVVLTQAGACPSYNLPYDPAVVPGSAGKRIDITGKVLLQDSQTPICALVLANGVHMFSCDGMGNYALNIPLDTNGQFKLQVYAEGSAPTIQTFDEFSAVNDVRMARASECQ